MAGCFSRCFLYAAFLLGIVIAPLGVAGATEPPAQPGPVGGAESENTAEAFAQLKTLVGVWRVADNEKSGLRIRFYLTAADTVLVESWEKGGEPHSLTVYYRDGPSLLATHYCPQGNQPRLALKPEEGAVMHFAFRDATDLDPGTESYQHDLSFDLSNGDTILRGETYYKGGQASSDSLRLVRVK